MGGGDMEPLGDDSAVDLLINNHTHSALVDVEDNTGAAVIVLEGHTLVDRGIDLNVHIVAALVVAEVGGGGASALGLEVLLEEGTGLGAITKAVRHFF